MCHLYIADWLILWAHRSQLLYWSVYLLSEFPGGIFRAIYIYYHSSTNKDPLTFSFLIYILLDLLQLSYAVAKTFRTVLTRHEESGQLCLFPNLSGIALSFSPIRLMLWLTAVIMLMYVPCISNLFRSFIMKWSWILLEAFSELLRSSCALCLWLCLCG